MLQGIHPFRRTFTHARTVRFGECDPAGIVYFPVFFNWFHEAMEAWFDEGLGHPYAQVLVERGFPSVHTEADFLRPCHMGDALFVDLRVAKLGRSSVDLAYRVRGSAGDVRATGATTCATVAWCGDDGVRNLRAVALPPALRAAMEAFVRDDFA